jgi:hypothetical protein
MLLTAAAAIPAAACGLTRDPTTIDLREELAVHAVLLAGDTNAKVLVTRMNSENSSWVASGVPDAQVQLSVGGTTITLSTHASNNCFSHQSQGDPSFQDINRGCYSARIASGLRSGTSWQLRVVTTDLGIATGTATLPAAPAISLPVAGTRIISEGGFLGGSPTFTTRWTGVPRTRLAEVDVNIPGDACHAYLAAEGGSGFGDKAIGVVQTDSLRARIGDSGCTISTQGLAAELRLVAYDSIYTGYKEANRGPRGTRQETSAFGLNGAVGVFAGAARVTVPITLIRQ